MRRVVLVSVLFGLTGGCTVAQQVNSRCANMEKRRIVVTIGIDRYSNWITLHAAAKDADDVEQMLVSRYGYVPFCSLPGARCGTMMEKTNTKPLRDENATRQNIEDTIDALGDYVCNQDDVIFFYSGHGGYRPDPNDPSNPASGKGYLIPVDAPAKDQHQYSRFVAVSEVLSDLKDLRAQNVLVVLDACYSGIAIQESLKSRMSGSKEIENDQQFLDSMATKKSRTVITAALPNQTASDSGQRPGNSLFTGVLLDELETGNAAHGHSFIDSTMLGADLKTEVTSASAGGQTSDSGPFEGDEFGELILPLHNDFDGLFQGALSALADGDLDTFSVRAKQAVVREPQNPLSTYLQYWMALANSDAAGALRSEEALMALPASAFPLRIDENRVLSPRDLRIIHRQLEFWKAALSIAPTPASKARVQIKLYTGDTEKSLLPVAGDMALGVAPNANLYFRMIGPLKDVYIYPFMVDGRGVIVPSSDLIDSRQIHSEEQFTSGSLTGPDRSDMQVWHFLISDHPIDEYASPPSATSSGTGAEAEPVSLSGVQRVVLRVKADNSIAN